MTREEQTFLKENCLANITVPAWRIRSLATNLHPTLRLPLDSECSDEAHSLTPFRIGDTFYISERWALQDPQNANSKILYKADYQGREARKQVIQIHWQPASHMPKEYARLYFRVRNVRVERLLSASTDDLLNEGSPSCVYTTDKANHRCYGNCQKCNDASSVRQQYRTLWNHEVSNLKATGYDSNPLTCILSLERI